MHDFMLENYQKAFKAYDIRGAYGKNIDEHFSYIMGKATGKHLCKSDTKLLIGCDVRLQNPALMDAFAAGLKASGFSSITYANFDADEQYPYGVCSTPVAYYLTQDDYDLWIVFTASHNPPGDVGMKFFDKDVVFLATEMLREIFEKEYDDEPVTISGEREISQVNDFLVNKVNQMYSFLDQKWSGLKKHHNFVVDFSNGAAVNIERDFFQKYVSKNHTLYMINDFPDGNFTAHHSDTQEHHNYNQLTLALQEHGAEFGLMFDGDADRIGIVGPDGKVIGGDLLTAMISKQILLEKNQNFQDIVLYETMSSKMVSEVVTGLGGEARMTRVGRYFINQELKACGGIFAGESSGHYLFAEIGGYEMSLLAVYYICKEMEEYSSRSEFVAAYKKYFKSPVISLVVSDKEWALQKVKNKYTDYDIKVVDWISVYAPDFWFNLRPSNTEDKIKFTVEADTQERMNEIVQELQGIV